MKTLAVRFEAFIPAAIFANSGVLLWGWVDQAHEVAAERVDTCFLLLFAVEMAVRLKRAGWQWLYRPWNLVDLAVVVIALLPIIGDGLTVLRLARAAKLVHLGRHVSHLRLATLLR